MVDLEFIDRQDEIRRIRQAIRQGENAAILGIRRIGKSALLKRISRLLAEEEDRMVLSVLGMTLSNPSDLFYAIST